MVPDAGEREQPGHPCVTGRPYVTPSKIPPKVEESANPDRRGGKRVLKIQPCFYQLSQIAGYEIVKFSDGHALSLNTSPGGLLLLMPQPPERSQVFEVHTLLSTEEERTLELVEACWTRELTFGATGKVYLVGVRSLVEPARTN
jgi:hypothetical protein